MLEYTCDVKHLLVPPSCIIERRSSNAKGKIKAVRYDCKQFFFRPEKTELDYDTSIFMRLWNVKNVVSAVLSTIIRL
jgi:hypothetical protein